MTQPVTGRQRASRIPLDYFKTPSLWERRKWISTVIAAVAAAAWWTVGILLGRQDASFHSPGSLASVHHTWESNCAACHAGFHPIREDTIAASWPLSPGWVGGTPESDQKCQACHRGAEHHPVAQGSYRPACSSCHQDHQGSQASLLRMDDRACTVCHQAVDQHSKGTPTLGPDAIRVTRFDKEHHPEFASARKESSHLKFSHYRHMMPGLVLVNDPRDQNETVLTLAKIDDLTQRERYRRPGQRDDAAVQLDCGSCHQLDGGDFGKSLPAAVSNSLPARPAGAYMLPITYENQCQACHPLYDKSKPGVLPAIVRHGQLPQEIRLALHRAFAEELYVRQAFQPDIAGRSQAGKPNVLERNAPPEPLPNAAPPGAESVERLIQGKIDTAEAKLSQEYCGKCHEFAASDAVLRPVIPPQVRQVWYDHARFDHKAHRAMECRECHAAAYADDTKYVRLSSLTSSGYVRLESPTYKQALIPERELCLKCHAPFQAGPRPSGGARFDCAECHRYHNGSAPLAGSGAQAESPVRKLKQEEFEAGPQ
jgi:predicted CXXCH cytochrome family protein